jgi:hypothetical protein
MERSVPLLTRPATLCSKHPLSHPYPLIECQAVWRGLSLSQQQAVFHQLVTICLKLASEAAATQSEGRRYDPE